MKYRTIRKERNEDGKFNYYYTITDKKKYLLSEWVEYCYDFREGFGKVRKDRKFNYAKPDGSFLLDEWVDDCIAFHNGFGVVRKDGKFNYVKPDGTYLLSEWPDYCWDFHDGFGVIIKNGMEYKIDKDGNTIKRWNILTF